MLTKKTGTLVRLRNGSALRTDFIVGWFVDPPTPGESFVFFGPPLDPKAVTRMVKTSRVVALRTIDDYFEFDTENSTYRLNDVQEHERPQRHEP
jgi:hypothetical protein